MSQQSVKRLKDDLNEFANRISVDSFQALSVGVGLGSFQASSTVSKRTSRINLGSPGGLDQSNGQIKSQLESQLERQREANTPLSRQTASTMARSEVGSLPVAPPTAPNLSTSPNTGARSNWNLSSVSRDNSAFNESFDADLLAPNSNAKSSKRKDQTFRKSMSGTVKRPWKFFYLDRIFTHLIDLMVAALLCVSAFTAVIVASSGWDLELILMALGDYGVAEIAVFSYATFIFYHFVFKFLKISSFGQIASKKFFTSQSKSGKPNRTI